MPATILVLDDDASFRRAVQPLLASRGHEVLEAGTGADADKHLQRRDVDLAIVDGLLPDTDGMEWIARLRERHATTPVVFVTAFRRDAATLRSQQKALRIDLVLRKPIIPAVFTEEVDRLLRAAAPQRPRERTPAPPERSRAEATLPPRAAERRPPPAAEPGREATPAPPPAPPVLEPVAAPAPPPVSEEQLLAELQDDYARQLPDLVGEANRAVAALRAKPADEALFARARTLVHRMRGSAGSFGFDGVGEAAGRIEDALVGAQGRPPALAAAAPAIDADLAFLQSAATTATARLAARARPGPPPAAAAAHGAISAPTPVPGTLGATAIASDVVLVVDDDPVFLRAVRELGRRHLVRVLEAPNVARALAAVREVTPDAALLDVRLGDAESAFDLARQLRALPGCEKLPVAFVSAAGDVADRVGAAHAGGLLFLKKPLDAATFGAALRQLLAARRAPPPAALLGIPDEGLRGLIASALERAECLATELPADTTDLVSALERLRPDVLALDVRQSGSSGLDLCRLLRTHPQWQDLPVLLVSESEWPGLRAAAFLAGADGLLTVPFDEDELSARVQGLADRARVRRERAEIDELTGLPMRRAFLRELSAQVSEMHRLRRGLVLCLLDVDGFREINRTHGGAAGDRVLAALGRLIAGSFLADVLRGRWDGDTMALGFPGEDVDTVSRIVSRVRNEFAGVVFPGAGASAFQAQFTWACAALGDEGELDSLVQRAEKLLDLARGRG